ncbi:MULTISPECIES: helix-turn-helix transcriptional regulator [Paenibacillus]|uniref:helix-turn-helix transcriptional regulator n=1 Tax=Paenibacillus TaxID=44249 RepID=UPI001F2F43BA|nr:MULTISPECIES: helix-turn-helix transcriptional regulator [Paenibacillus]
MILHLAAPPLPYYIASGTHRFTPGQSHLNRQHIHIFDLLYVRSGCLYMGEEERRYEVREGQALILLPDRHHFGSRGCTEATLYDWLHFSTSGPWGVRETGGSEARHPEARHSEGRDSETKHSETKHSETRHLEVGHLEAGDLVSSLQGSSGKDPALRDFEANPFLLRLPQYTTLPRPARMEELLDQLTKLAPEGHLSGTPLRQQILFQEILSLLGGSLEAGRFSPQTQCAELAASFLRGHYREEITASRLGESLNFHPVYIARCMNKAYGCSPMEYLLRYRIEQSKLLLMQTGYSVARIAEEVGFRSAPYFSATFCKLEGVSPRQFRRQFS